MSDLEVIEHSLISHTPNSYETITQTNLIAFAASQKKITLILDLDETLVHSSFQKTENYDIEVPIIYNENSYLIYVKKRPGVDFFLNNIPFFYDLYIFTASMPQYSIPVIKQLLPDFPENKILTRQHCSLVNGFLVKDLSIFRRNLSDMIIIDNNKMSFQLNPENGIEVPTWIGNEEDDILISFLLPFLESLNHCNDVRIEISKLYE